MATNRIQPALPSEIAHILNHHLGVNTPPSVDSANINRQSSVLDEHSVILNISDTEDYVPGTSSSSQGQGQHGRTHNTSRTPEQLWKLVERYSPFLFLLFAKLMYEHRLGLLCLLGFYGTFYCANITVKKSVLSREPSSRSVLTLLSIPIFLFINTVMIYYVFDHEQLYKCIIFLKPNVKRFDLTTLLWVVGVTDFILRFLSIGLKCVIAVVPRCIIALKSKGKCYMLIEHSIQYYRRLIPIVPWYFFLTDTTRGGIWFSWLLWAIYSLFKLKTLYTKTRELWKIVRSFLSDTTYGVPPSHCDMSSSEGCPICQDDYIHPVMLSCKHIFCEDCVSMWFDREQTCPMCRSKVVKDAPTWRDGSTSLFMQLF